jgi:replicative DNA helicase
MTKTLEELEQIASYSGSDRVVHFTEFLLESMDKNSSAKRFNCDFRLFDEKMGGIETGEVVVITGHRKEGKTLFAESWINSILKTNPEAKSFILSYEVNAEKILAKYVPYAETQIYLPMELKTMDFQWLADRCLEAKVKHNCQIVMIDHLHFMVDMNTQQNMSLNIGAFMRRLKKDIALDMNLAVILIAHQGQPKDGKEASMDSIRDSSFVAQESDAVIAIGRRENLDTVELSDFLNSQGEEKADLIKPPAEASFEDKFSAQLALVKIECNRRTGTFHFKKLFQKRGDFMEEV